MKVLRVLKGSVARVDPKNITRKKPITMVQGGRVGGLKEPPLGIHFVTIFRKDFALSRKPVACSTR